MIVDPWIQDHSVVTIGANRLKINTREGLEDLSLGLVTWKGQVGQWVPPMWHRPPLISPPFDHRALVGSQRWL